MQNIELTIFVLSNVVIDLSSQNIRKENVRFLSFGAFGSDDYSHATLIVSSILRDEYLFC